MTYAARRRLTVVEKPSVAVRLEPSKLITLPIANHDI